MVFMNGPDSTRDVVFGVAFSTCYTIIPCSGRAVVTWSSVEGWQGGGAGIRIGRGPLRDARKTGERHSEIAGERVLGSWGRGRGLEWREGTVPIVCGLNEDERSSYLGVQRDGQGHAWPLASGRPHGVTAGERGAIHIGGGRVIGGTMNEIGG